MTENTSEVSQEPGVVSDLSLGLPGDAEPMPSDDADHDYPTEINDDDDDPDDDGEDEVDE